MTPTNHANNASKALSLAGRYARLQVRSAECKHVCGRLLDQCENLRHNGDSEEPGWSGCMEAYREWRSDTIKEGERLPVHKHGWDAVLDDLEFCRPCRLAMRVWSHRKTMHRRRASVLGAIKRIGLRAQKDTQ